MTKSGNAVVLALLGVSMSAVNAQPADIEVQQIAADGSDESVTGPADRSGTDALAPADQQISKSGQGVPASVQLTDEKRSARTPAQLTSERKSAQASTPLSKPSEGRRPALERIEGEDRCDPVLEKYRDVARCARVIETRAAEFERERPRPLSPEERILLERLLAEADDARSAARRLAITGDDSGSEFASGVASIVLRRDSKDDSGEDGQSESALEQGTLSEQILKSVLGVPPPP